MVRKSGSLEQKTVRKGREEKLIPCYDVKKGKVCIFSRKGGLMCSVPGRADLLAQSDSNGCCFVRSHLTEEPIYVVKKGGKHWPRG